LQSLGGEFLPHARLVARIDELRSALLELNARVVRADRDVEATLDVALRMLRMRRVLLPEGGGYVVLPHGRELVSYYANSVAHLLGPVREPPSAPATRFRRRSWRVGRSLAALGSRPSAGTRISADPFTADPTRIAPDAQAPLLAL
jgi:hypothetical protein